MRKFFLISVILISINLHSQSFYEVKWTSNQTDYTALIVYFDKSEIDVRVNYSIGDNYRVAHYKARGSIIDREGGTNDYWFDGFDANLVYSENESNSGYNADNFLFSNLDGDGVFQELYVVDDEEMKKENYSYEIAEFNLLEPSIDFTISYINSFFASNEPEYSTYINLGPDMEDVNALFKKIASELEMPIHVSKLVDDNFSLAGIEKSLKEINSQANDIILFYYSGHGYNKPERNSGYPEMALTGKHWGLDEIYNTIAEKNHRLFIVVGDLCNSIPETKLGVKEESQIPFKSGSFFERTKLENLFLKPKGGIIVSSSKKGQFSYCMTDPNGTMGNGYFTFGFINSLVEECSMASTESGDWSNILQRTYTQVYNSTKAIRNQDSDYGQKGIQYLDLKK